MNFKPVSTLEDLSSLHDDQIVEGYRAAKRGDPEPGHNHGRAYWHGWCNRMRDMGELPYSESSAKLAREYVAFSGLIHSPIGSA